MIFNEHNIQLGVINVFDMQCPKKIVESVGNGVGCPWYAISFRKQSNSIISYGDTEFHLSSNSILYVPPEVHFTKNTLETENIIVVHFRAIGEMDNNIYCFKPVNPIIFEKLFTEMLHTYENKAPGYRLKLNEQIYRIMYLILKDEIKTDSQGITIAEKLATLIEQELSNPYFSTDSASSIFKLSNTRIRVLFKEKYGISPKEYQIKRRMEMAETMLKTNCFTIKETANKCGYENEKYFSTAFKKIYGITPTEFKQL